jgi:hypothetical protein
MTKGGNDQSFSEINIRALATVVNAFETQVRLSLIHFKNGSKALTS